VAGVRTLGGVDLWPWLGVPSGPSTFFDARNVMAALECRRMGLDPLIENPCDPWGRPVVYPRTWLLLRFLGLDQSDTTMVAVVAILVFVGAFLWVLGRLTLGGGAIAALAVCSPAVMLAVERANMDLVVFALLVAAIAAWARPGYVRTVASPAGVLLASLAKVYPVFGLAGFLASRERRAMMAAVGGGALFLVWAAVTRDDLIALAERAPQGEYYSYGARILLSRAFRVIFPDGWGGGQATTQVIAALPVVLLGLASWIWVRKRIIVADHNLGPRTLAFHIGALVYLGTFFIGNNFDYRLVFVLLTLPQLFAWTASDDARNRLGAAALLSVVVLLWVGSLSRFVAALDEIFSWATAFLLFSLIAASFPSVREVVQLLIGKDRRQVGAGAR
jgi:Glycosyltransferase family 87